MTEIEVKNPEIARAQRLVEFVVGELSNMTAEGRMVFTMLINHHLEIPEEERKAKTPN